MNTSQANGNKRKKGRLFPLAVLLGVLGIPVALYADQQACQACLSNCYAQLAACQQDCLSYPDGFERQQCYNACGNNVAGPCFGACSAGPCSG